MVNRRIFPALTSRVFARRWPSWWGIGWKGREEESALGIGPRPARYHSPRSTLISQSMFRETPGIQDWSQGRVLYFGFSPRPPPTRSLVRKRPLREGKVSGWNKAGASERNLKEQLSGRHGKCSWLQESFGSGKASGNCNPEAAVPLQRCGGASELKSAQTLSFLGTCSQTRTTLSSTK